MASKEFYNKIIFGGETKLDLSGDDVSREDVLKGKKFHLRTGEATTGTCEYDADTSDATAAASEILNGETAYVDGQKVTGTMPNRGAVAGTISTKAGTYTVQNGYHDGSGTVGIDSTEQAKIIGANIKAGVSILGEEGTYTGEGVSAQTKIATPSMNQQTILPDTGYDYLSQVTVNPIPYTETDNAYGITLTIG